LTPGGEIVVGRMRGGYLEMHARGLPKKAGVNGLQAGKKKAGPLLALPPK